MLITSPVAKAAVCVASEQDVPVPTVQVSVVAEPFFRTVTAPDEAFTPPVPDVTCKFSSVPARFITWPMFTVVLVQVVAVNSPREKSPNVELAVAVPLQAPCSVRAGEKLMFPKEPTLANAVVTVFQP